MITRLMLAGLGALVLAAPAYAADAGAGEQVFRKCTVCHAIGPGANSRIGPELNGVIGRKAGSVAGYRYSEANANSDLIWSEENLAPFLHNPKAAMPGTKMMFPGLKDDKEVDNVIAYLKQFDLTGQKVTP
jgi:cytochrome c